MKKTLLLSSVAVLSAVASFAQTKAPQAFNYQGAIRKSDGTPLATKSISLRLSILKDSPTGATEYWEIRNVTSNSLGLYTVAIGSAGAISTSTTAFNQIAWGAGDKYFKVEVDLDGTGSVNANFIPAGTAPVLSVPYAIYAEKGGSSGYNTWAAKPENASANTPDDYLNYLKNQAAATVTAAGKDLTANSGIAGLLTITTGTGALLQAAAVNLDKSVFDKAAQDAVAAGFANPGNPALQAALDGANATLLANPNSATAKALDGANATLIANPNSATAKALGDAAKDAANPLNAGIQEAIGAAAKDGASPVTAGLVSGLVGPNGTPGSNAPLQDAITGTVTNALSQNPAADPSAAKDLQDALKSLVAGNGQDLTKSTQTNNFITINGSDKNAKAVLVATDLGIDKTALNAAVAEQVAAPAPNPLADALNKNTSDALTAMPPSASQQALQDAINNNLAGGISDAIATPATGTPAQQALADAIKAAAGTATAGAGALKADNTGTDAANILSIPDGAAAAFHDATYVVSKLALNNNTTEAINNPTPANGGTDLAAALDRNATAALTANPANPTQQAYQDALNNNLAGGITDAIATPATGTPAQQALADAIKAAAGSATSGAAGITSDDANTTATTIIDVQNGANSTFKDVVLSVNKGNLQNAVAEGFASPGNPALKSALDGANAALITDPTSATAKALGDAAKDTTNPLNAGTNKANADALTAVPPAATPEQLAFQDAVKSLVDGNGKDLTKTVQTNNFITINGTDKNDKAVLADTDLGIDKTAFNAAMTEQVQAPAPNPLADALNKNTTDALNNPTPAAGSPAAALQQAVKDQAAATTAGNGTLSATEVANAAATATSPVLSVVDPANKATFQNVAVNLDKDALKQNIAKGLTDASATPATGTAADQALAAAIGTAATKNAADGTVTTADDGTDAAKILTIGAAANTQAATTFANLDLKVSKDALNNNTTAALNNPAPGSSAAALQQAVKDQAGKATSGAAGALADNAGTDAANILTVTTGAANSTFKDVTYQVSKLALNNNTTNALNNPTPANGGTALSSAVKTQAAAAATKTVSANTGQDVVTVTANPNSTFVDVPITYSQANADVANAASISAAGNPMNTAVKTQAAAAATKTVSANTGQDVVTVTANPNSTFVDVPITYSQANADVANAASIGAAGNPMNTAVKTQAAAAATKTVSANTGQDVVTVTANPNSTFVDVPITYSQANADIANAASIGAAGNPMNTAVKTAATTTEPWNVVGGTTKATANTESIYQNAMVGIGDFSATAPTEQLDIAGNARVRALPDGSAVDYTRTVVAKVDGTLGYQSGASKAVLNITNPAAGLIWNTANSVGGSTPTSQSNFSSFFIFGNKSDITAPSAPQSGGYTKTSAFTAPENAFLQISTDIAFNITENISGTTLNTLSPNGDRQVILYLFLYKGGILLKKTKEIINFNGRNDGVTPNGYEANFQKTMALNYLIPAGATGTDYSVSVVATVKAPNNGLFRISFKDTDNNGTTQKIAVVKL